MRIRFLLSSSIAFAFALGCGGGEGGTNPGGGGTAVTPVVTLVAVAPQLATVEMGTTTTMTAEVRDQFGAVMAGKAPAWSSSNPAVATVNATSGVVTGVTVGSATITASVEGKSGSATAAVFPPPVKSVVVGAVPATITAGQAFTLTVALKDRNGADLTGRTVTWSSGAARIATVDANGRVTTFSAGTVVITALSEGVSGTANLVVAPPAGTTLASITSIAPATLAPGAAATVTGTNFGATVAGNIVWVAGVPAVITAASSTQLSFTVPTSGIPCQSTQPVNVEVTTVAGTVGAKQPLTVATQRTLAVGASMLVTATGNIGCNELPATGTYIVSVFNAAKDLSQSASVELTGAAGGVLANAIPVNQGVRPTLISAPVAPVRSPVDPAMAAAASEHLRRLTDAATFRRIYGSPSQYRRGSRVNQSRIGVGSQGSALQSPVPLTVGATASMKFNYNTCTAAGSPTITARVVYVGPKTVVLEDNASALAGKIDADMIGLATDFENVSWPILQKFGDPLAYDAQTDNNGKIIMLFTPRVNQAGSNLLGFVQPCDFFRPTDFAGVSGSNQAEIFYARAVTDTTATSTSLNGRPLWKRLMPSTLIHETKHIIANAERQATPILVNDDEEVWLEEATAQLASEMYGRAIHGNGWRTNASYFGTLDCEVRPTTPTCGGGVYVMGNHFGFLTEFLENIETKTILSGQDDNDIYGSSWMFTRWLVDTYGGSDESAILHKIVLNYNVLGVDNVTNVTGKTWPELLSQFSLMLAADDLTNSTAPFVEPSWNLPGVFQGYSGDVSSRPPASPLVPRTAAFGTFTTSTVSLKGGGVMLVRVGGTGSGATQLFDLHQAGGTSIPSTSNIGLAILRIQ
ncbi:MAG: Ig-like domain-containing protein [bacterium]